MAAMQHAQKLCLVLMWMICLARSARILGIVHMPPYSHFQLGDRIFRELAARGHDVTVISPHELKNPPKNLKHVVLTGFLEAVQVKKKNLLEETGMSVVTKVVGIDIVGIHFTESVLKHENVQQLLHSEQKFDLVIYENLVSEAFSGFAYHYKVPYVLLSTIGSSRWTNPKMGNPNNPAYIPDVHLSYSRNMDFCERVINSFVYLGAELFSHLYTYPKQNELLQKYFPGAPHLSDLMYNASLTLLNSHPSISAPVPLVPNMIEIGAYHVQPPKTLPKDLQDYLDGAKDGVVFFSMGSNIKSKDLPMQKRNDILKVLGELKEKILWKWEDDKLPGQPPNVKLAKWLPQQDILAHPNIKVFITHGGLLSTIEAIYHGVPVLGIPVFGDQELNVANAERDGYGIGLPYRQLNEANFRAALKQLLQNETFSKNAKRRSALMDDQPTKPLDRAMYWIEYVIRHQGAPHLKTAALNLNWHQYLLLDIVSVVILSIIICVWILCKLVAFVCCKKPNIAVNKSKKQK